MTEYRMTGEFARNTLKWLVAAQRPVTVFELHAIIHIARSRDRDPFEAAGKFMTTTSHYAINADERKAVSAIEELLGERVLEYTRVPGLGNSLCVRLAPGSRRVVIEGEEFFDLVQEIDTTKSEAHQYALSICLGICRVTTLSFANLRNERPHLLGLVTYAWTYWSVHHCLTYNYTLPYERHLLDATLMDQLRRTIREVLFDTVRMLTDLNGRLIPLATQPAHGKVDALASLSKDALDLLDTPMCLLSNMIKLAPEEPTAVIVADLAMGRRICRNSIYLQPTDGIEAEESLSRTNLLGLHFNMVPDAPPAFAWERNEAPGINLNRAECGLSGLDTDTLLKVVKSQKALGSCRETMVIFAEAACQMRQLCIPIAQKTLSQELLENPTSASSLPLDTLLNAAKFLEAVACYPFWNLMPKPYSEQYLEVADTDPDSGVNIVRYRYRNYDERYFIEHREDPRVKLDLSRLSHPGTKPSWVRIVGYPFLALEMKRNMFPNLSTNQQSWEAAIDNAQRGSSPGARIFAHLHGPFTFTEVGLVDWVYFLLKGAIISKGCISALFNIAMAIVLNHVRTIFMPWLGIGIWQNPLEQLRLARSNPEVFLDEFHTQRWIFILFSLAQPIILELLASVTVLMVATCNRFAGNKLMTTYRAKYTTLWFVSYIAWFLTTVEYFFSVTVVYFALTLAFWNLASGGSESAYLALRMVMAKHRPKMVLIAGHMGYFLRFELFPVLSIAIQSAAEGRIGLSLFIGGLVALVRAIIVHRSFFFIALEVSGMFVATGWLLVGCCVLLVWFRDDPLWVKRIVKHAVRDGKIAKTRVAEVLTNREENPNM